MTGESLLDRPGLRTLSNGQRERLLARYGSGAGRFWDNQAHKSNTRKSVKTGQPAMLPFHSDDDGGYMVYQET